VTAIAFADAIARTDSYDQSGRTYPSAHTTSGDEGSVPPLGSIPSRAAPPVRACGTMSAAVSTSFSSSDFPPACSFNGATPLVGINDLTIVILADALVIALNARGTTKPGSFTNFVPAGSRFAVAISGPETMDMVSAASYRQHQLGPLIQTREDCGDLLLCAKPRRQPLVGYVHSTLPSSHIHPPQLAMRCTVQVRIWDVS
jgi:hypothetical protein